MQHHVIEEWRDTLVSYKCTDAVNRITEGDIFGNEIVRLMNIRVGIRDCVVSRNVEKTLESNDEIVSWKGGNCIHPEGILVVRDNGVNTWLVWRNSTAAPTITTPKFMIQNIDAIYSEERPLELFLVTPQTVITSVAWPMSGITLWNSHKWLSDWEDSLKAQTETREPRKQLQAERTQKSRRRSRVLSLRRAPLFKLKRQLKQQ